MPLDHLPPNCRDGIRIDRFAERYYDLLDVNARIRPAQAMEDHSRLSWRHRKIQSVAALSVDDGRPQFPASLMFRMILPFANHPVKFTSFNGQACCFYSLVLVEPFVRKISPWAASSTTQNMPIRSIRYTVRRPLNSENTMRTRSWQCRE